MTHSANYDFVVEEIRSLSAADPPRVLDFGCGLGAVVELGLSRGLDIVGADTFGHYPAWRDEAPRSVAGRLYQISGPLPFPDASFDVVVSNQVFEHIPDPRTVLPEISRVLKPGGIFLALFPVRETWYEGHVGLYFAHWLQSRPRLQRAYLRLAHRCGFGLHRGEDTAAEWAERSASYLAADCFYHRRRDVEYWLTDAFGQAPQCKADDFVSFRLRDSRLARWLPAPILRRIAHIRAGVVLAVRKAPSARESTEAATPPG